MIINNNAHFVPLNFLHYSAEEQLIGMVLNKCVIALCCRSGNDCNTTECCCGVDRQWRDVPQGSLSAWPFPWPQPPAINLCPDSEAGNSEDGRLLDDDHCLSEAHPGRDWKSESSHCRFRKRTSESFHRGRYRRHESLCLLFILN